MSIHTELPVHVVQIKRRLYMYTCPVCTVLSSVIGLSATAALRVHLVTAW